MDLRSGTFKAREQMKRLLVKSPAKINLMLAVHGVRPDGFHGLTSIIAPLTFGDQLRISFSKSRADAMSCDDPKVPTGDENLILRAAQLFRRVSGLERYFNFSLEKRIPMGAGLGGGSSNAAAALKAMNELAGAPLNKRALLEVAAELGSDCPFFIDAQGAQISGRGEVIDTLPSAVCDRLRGQRIVLFRPHFGVSTAWAYSRLRDCRPDLYQPESVSRRRVEDFVAGGAVRDLLFNNFEACVGEKYLAIPCLLEELRVLGYACLMSGSGSCCFALLEAGQDVSSIKALCVSAWGSDVFFVESWLA